MRASVVEDYAVLLRDRDAVLRARVIADIARERDPRFPAWEQLPAHTQLDLVEVAAKGMKAET